MPQKKYKIHFHAKDRDHILDEKDIQQQVEQLQLYRDNKTDSVVPLPLPPPPQKKVLEKNAQEIRKYID